MIRPWPSNRDKTAPDGTVIQHAVEKLYPARNADKYRTLRLA